MLNLWCFDKPITIGTTIPCCLHFFACSWARAIFVTSFCFSCLHLALWRRSNSLVVSGVLYFLILQPLIQLALSSPSKVDSLTAPLDDSPKLMKGPHPCFVNFETNYFKVNQRIKSPSLNSFVLMWLSWNFFCLCLSAYMRCTAGKQVLSNFSRSYNLFNCPI